MFFGFIIAELLRKVYKTEKKRKAAFCQNIRFTPHTFYDKIYWHQSYRKGSDTMIQLDQIKSELPIAKANLKEAGESL